MTPIRTYRVTSNFVTRWGIDKLQQIEDDLNNGLSVDRIAAVNLHCSTRRAYVLRNAMFQQVWVLKDSAREFVENYIKSEECKIQRAIKFSHKDTDNKKMRLIICKTREKSAEG